MPPIVCDHDELCAGKNFMQISWLCISNSSQGLTPLDGMRCSLNIPGHPIIATEMLIKLPLNEMEKPQLPMITFLIIFKIQLYFVRSLSINKSPEKCLTQT